MKTRVGLNEKTSFQGLQILNISQSPDSWDNSKRTLNIRKHNSILE